MKLTPVNGINVCELVFVAETDIFSTCFNFRTIYQVSTYVINSSKVILAAGTAPHHLQDGGTDTRS